MFVLFNVHPVSNKNMSDMFTKILFHVKADVGLENDIYVR